VADLRVEHKRYNVYIFIHHNGSDNATTVNIENLDYAKFANEAEVHINFFSGVTRGPGGRQTALGNTLQGLHPNEKKLWVNL